MCAALRDAHPSRLTGGSLLGTVTFGSGTGAGSAGLAGSKKNFRLPSGTINRYLGVQYSMVTGASGAGTIDAWLGMDSQTPTE